MAMINVTGQSALHSKEAGYAAELNDYRDCSSYICDAVSEIADRNISIYCGEVAQYIADHVDEVADIINELGWDGCGRDLYKAGQMAEYRELEQNIYDHLSDGLLVCAYDFVAYDLHIGEIPEELDEMIREWCADADSDDRMDEIPDKIREWISAHTEEGEEEREEE